MEQANTKTGSGTKKALWAATAIIVVVGAGAVGAKVYYQKQVEKVIAERGATAASVDVDFLGQVHIRDLTLPLEKGEKISVASVDGRPKLPFADGVLELSNISMDVAKTNIVIPNARIENAEVERPASSQADGKDADISLSKRIERFSAKRISMPVVTVSQSIGSVQQKIAYTNAVLSDIAHGRIEQYTIDKTSIDASVAESGSKSASQPMTMSTGEIKGQDIDLAYAARLYTEAAGPDDKEPKQVYGRLSISKLSMSDRSGRFSYEELRSDGFSAKMPAQPLVETLAAITAVQNIDDLTSEQRQAYFGKVLSIFGMIGKSNIQLIGLKIDAADEVAGTRGKRSISTIDRIEMQIEGYKTDFGLHGLSIANGEDKVLMEEASIKGLDWTLPAKGLTQAAALEADELATFPVKQFFPTFDRLRLAGLDFDTSGTKKSDEPVDGKPERIKFTLKNFETVLKDPVNGIPTDFENKMEDLVIPIPEGSSEFAEARALGFKELTLSYALSSAWDEKNSSLAIRQISVSGKDFGRIELSGLLSGITKEFFSFDAANAYAALFSVMGREIKFTWKDEGGVALLTKLYALQNNISEAQARTTLTLGASFLLQQVAAERPQLRSATDALAAFVLKPGTLTVTVKAKSPNGLGIFDLAAASQDPLVLLDKVDIQAAAE
ncbi:hypothetical protein QE369_001668 [Agrobacterium larrymoorei]|uniref:Uncharacterized protein n=1 Tax=Agrobacterium larrymoorei TaxID=160699 RepID=A0AAJ2B8N7_9HYPH|nr:hypothetical protein [Agrobacterium larrymoorei]MDR6101490.1 hypothetical protein [Agrobacterium larrymoorei]